MISSSYTRWMLTGCSAVAVLAALSFSGAEAAAKASGDDSVIVGVMAVLGLAAIGCAVAAYQLAREHGRPAWAWSFMCLLFPYLFPWFLLWATPSGGPRSITLAGGALEIGRGWGRKDRIALDALRDVTVKLPAGGSWYGIVSSSERLFVPLDLVPREQAEALCGALTAQCAAAVDPSTRKIADHKALDALETATLFLVDYDNRAEQLSMRACALAGVDLLGAIMAAREQRLERLGKWFAADGSVALKGTFWWKARLSRAGYQRGKRVLPWPEVGSFYVESSTGSTTLYVLPKGVKAGFFSVGKFRHGIPVRKRDADLYTAECNFFRTAFGGGGRAGA